jgi:hypothetical protein
MRRDVPSRTLKIGIEEGASLSAPDGSLDIYLQSENPGSEKEANLLPAPNGPFTLTMRLYAPKSDALTGK